MMKVREKKRHDEVQGGDDGEAWEPRFDGEGGDDDE